MPILREICLNCTYRNSDDICGLSDKAVAIMQLCEFDPIRFAPRQKTPTDDLLKKRQDTHGDFSQTAMIAQMLKDDMHKTKNWNRLSCSQQEGLELIATKIGRILCGDIDFIDHWEDIAGYATLAAEDVK